MGVITLRSAAGAFACPLEWNGYVYFVLIGGQYMPIIVKKVLVGAFEKLDGQKKELVMEIVAHFHYRDGKRQPDGSMGSIEISPGELRDCIAYGFQT